MLSEITKQLLAPSNTLLPAWASKLAPLVVHAHDVSLAEQAVAKLELSVGDGVGLVTATVPYATVLSAEGLRRSVTKVLGLVLADLRDSGFRYPVRMWTFVPGIHDQVGQSLDRYRAFNEGRYDAFTHWFGCVEVFDAVLPAASTVGHDGDCLSIFALGLCKPGLPVENPRQVPAFEYSQSYGPRPPCFARAMVADLPIGTRLLVSGTASIRGEDSLHMGCIRKQLDETFENLHRLMVSVQGSDCFSLNGVETARAYFPRAADRAELVRRVSAQLPIAAVVEYVPALICRPELLVEIEATVAPTLS